MGQGQQSPYAQGRRGNQGLAVPTEVPWCVLLRGHHVSRPNHTAVLADALLIHLALPQRFSHKPRRCPLSAISVLPPKPWCCGCPSVSHLSPGPCPGRGHPRAGPQPPVGSPGHAPAPPQPWGVSHLPVQPCQRGTLREEVVPIVGLKSTGPTPHPLPTSQP